MTKIRAAYLFGQAGAAALLAFTAPTMARAQDAAAAAAPPTTGEVVVTGSRIRRDDLDSPAPITFLNPGDLTDRGYVQVGQLLNEVTANSPSFPVPPFVGGPAQNEDTPDLFNLGDGRTLTLVNGRRMVATGQGVYGRGVDTNMIPTGLLERVDIDEGGGAAVYGSDAIAGVVNYILKDKFQGLEFDAQDGISSRSDNRRPALRVTAGKNFADGRGNIAVDVEWSKTDPLLNTARPWSSGGQELVTNPANTSTTDGQPPQIYAAPVNIWTFNSNGVIFGKNNRDATGLLGYPSGNYYQFAPDGSSIIPYNPGNIQTNSSEAIGGQGFPLYDLSSLASGENRYVANMVGHYDITDHIKASTELLYFRKDAVDLVGTQSIVNVVGDGPGYTALSFYNNNAFLTPAEVAQLTALQPSFGTGSPLLLSKYYGILPSEQGHDDSQTWRALFALDGDFSAIGRNFTWSLSASHAGTHDERTEWAPYTAHLLNAINAVRNSSGQIVCAINAVTVVDPACAPINMFTQTDQQSAAARAYVSGIDGQKSNNYQDDILAVFGGDLVKLPAGMVKFSASYEHRYESSTFKPSIGDVQGLFYDQTPTLPEAGSYHTDEYAAEMLIPLVGGNFTLPFVKRLEVTGSYREVDNSLAGQEAVWGVGARWEVAYGLTMRVSRSRNFSAPTLDEQFAPTQAQVTFIGSDPCEPAHIVQGNDPAARLANCTALFAAHPSYGSLATFQDPADNTSFARVTSGGNPNLKNEVSNTLSWGFGFAPTFLPGFSMSADRIEINLTNALSDFSVASFAALCYDTSPQQTQFCNTFTRNAQGFIDTAHSEYFNAGYLIYKGEEYKANYRFPIDRFLPFQDAGNGEIRVAATHNAFEDTSVTGFDNSRSDGTTSLPSWRLRLDVNYTKGPLKLSYSMDYLPPAKSSFTATIETTPYPVVPSNTVHSVSVQYDLNKTYTLRAGVNNLLDTGPKFYDEGYGDLYGRQYFVGLHAKF